MRKLIFVLAAVLSLLVLTAQVRANQRVALVIGNAKYKHAPTLANPLNDAGDLGAALDRLGFKVSRLDNADYDKMRRGLRAFTRAASMAEVALVFYAGHGIEVDKRNFLDPGGRAPSERPGGGIRDGIAGPGIARGGGGLGPRPRDTRRLPGQPVRRGDEALGREALDRTRSCAGGALGRDARGLRGEGRFRGRGRQGQEQSLHEGLARPRGRTRPRSGTDVPQGARFGVKNDERAAGAFRLRLALEQGLLFHKGARGGARGAQGRGQARGEERRAIVLGIGEGKPRPGRRGGLSQAVSRGRLRNACAQPLEAALEPQYADARDHRGCGVVARPQTLGAAAHPDCARCERL